MKNLRNAFSASLFLLFITFSFSQCTDPETPEPDNKGKVGFEMTDAPIDDANVQSAFVTVASIKVDGETYSGFSGKQTIDLLAYQNGNTKALGLGELEVGTYSNISLVLDYKTDADGNSPGCYILTTDNTKHDLSNSANSTQEIFVEGAVTVTKDATSTMVMDFDVRKAVHYDDQGAFSFVTSSEMSSAVRMEDKPKTGTISGKISGNTSNNNKLVVYAYKKGTYSKNTETQGQGQSNIEFKNAVTSALVDAEGNYQLSFLKEGEYEVHTIAYEDTNNDGKIEATASAELLSTLSLNILGITVESNTTINLDLTITGFLSF